MWLDRHMTSTATKFIARLVEHFVAMTTDPQDRLTLVRTMAVRPVTGGPVHGWHA